MKFWDEVAELCAGGGICEILLTFLLHLFIPPFRWSYFYLLFGLEFILLGILIIIILVVSKRTLRGAITLSDYVPPWEKNKAKDYYVDCSRTKEERRRTT